MDYTLAFETHVSFLKKNVCDESCDVMNLCSMFIKKRTFYKNHISLFFWDLFFESPVLWLENYSKTKRII